MSTQNPTEFLAGEAYALAILENCHTLVLDLKKSSIEKLRAVVDLSEQEDFALLKMPPANKLFIVGMDRALVKVVASDPEPPWVSTRISITASHISSRFFRSSITHTATLLFDGPVQIGLQRSQHLSTLTLQVEVAAGEDVALEFTPALQAPGIQVRRADDPVCATAVSRNGTGKRWFVAVFVGLNHMEVCPQRRQQQVHEFRVVKDNVRRTPETPNLLE